MADKTEADHVLELVARLRALPDDARRALIDDLQDAAKEALTSDPSVGIWAWENLAEGYRILDQLVGSGELGRRVAA